MNFSSISSVTPLLTPRALTKASLFSKVTKVALISLALFVAALVIIRISRGLKATLPQMPPNRPAVIKECVYHSDLIRVVGGQDKFDQISTLEAEKTKLSYVARGLNPYLTIQGDHMTQTFMKGKDELNRLFFAFKYRKKETQEVKVDIFLCRDPEHNRWYYNDERAEVNWSMTLYFLQMLVQKNHSRYELV